MTDDFKTKIERLLIDADTELTMNGNLYLEPTNGLPEVRKLAAFMPEPSRWTRARMRIRTWRVRAGQRIGSTLAGERLLTQDEVDDLRSDW